MGRSSALVIFADRYVLRACERHNVDPVLLCNSSAYDGGRVRVPEGGTLLRVDDITNPEDLLATLHRAGLGDRRFDGVQTTWEYSVVTAAALGRVLGARAMDPVTALYFRDKSLQKERLRAAGIPVTRTVLVPDVHDVSEVPWEFEPAVLKPIAGAATTYTSVVRSRAELEAASRTLRESGTAKRTFLLEEFVDADEWIADGVVFDGNVLFFGLGRYTEPCLDAVSSQKPISMWRMDPDRDADAYKNAEPVVRAAIEALGMREGVFHMELFSERDTGRILFSECAARRGGAMTQEQILAKFNVDLGEAALLCAIGREPQLDVKINPDVVGCVALFGPPGTLVSYPTPDELLAQPDVAFAQMYVPPGATLSPTFTDSVDMLGAVLLASPSAEAFAERVTQLRDWFTERIVTIQPGLTTAQRWAWQRTNWPDREYRDWLFDPQ